MIADLDGRASYDGGVGEEPDVNLAAQFARQSLLIMPSVVILQLDRRRHGGVDDARRFVGKALKFFPDAMALAGPIVLDQQAEEVFRFGAQLRLEQLGAPGVDRVLLLGQQENARGVAARHAARFRHEFPPPRWCARSTRDASLYRGSRR